MTRVLVVCEDAGGARAVAPVAARLAEGGHSVGAVLGSVARQVFASDGVEVPAVGLDALRSSDALLTSSTCWGERIEAKAILEARSLGVPSLTVMDFWSQYGPRLSYPGESDLSLVPTALTAIDATMRADLEALGVPAARLHVTGSPAFDQWFVRPLPPPPPSPAVLFVSQPIAALYGDSLGYTERSVLETLAELASALGASVVVRPHPREDPAAVEALAAACAGDVRVEAGGSLRDAMGAATAVVGMTSVALVEAAVAGRPAISAQLAHRGDDPLPTNRVGLTRLATDRGSLARALTEAFARDHAAPRGDIHAGATERVVDLLDRMLQGGVPAQR